MPEDDEIRILEEHTVAPPKPKEESEPQPAPSSFPSAESRTPAAPALSPTPAPDEDIVRADLPDPDFVPPKTEPGTPVSAPDHPAVAPKEEPAPDSSPFGLGEKLLKNISPFKKSAPETPPSEEAPQEPSSTEEPPPRDEETPAHAPLEMEEEVAPSAEAPIEGVVDEKNVSDAAPHDTPPRAPAVPKKQPGISSENEAARNELEREGFLLQETPVTPVRDPRFAAQILSQQGRPERPIPLPSTKAKLRPYSSQNAPSLVRTFEGDVAKALEKGDVSLAQMILREEKELPLEDEKPARKRKIATVSLVVGTIFVLAGAGLVIGGTVFYKNYAGTKTPPKTTISSLIFSEKVVDVSLPSGGLAARTALREQLEAGEGALDSILRFRPITTITSEEGVSQKIPQGAANFLGALGVGAPDSLRRSLSDEFLLGAYFFDGTQPFLLLKTDSFESAFAGMLLWEEEGLAEDFAEIFSLPTVSEDVPLRFLDIVLKNRDIRAIPHGESFYLFYTFIDQETLLITTRESTLDEVVRRFYRKQ